MVSYTIKGSDIVLKRFGKMANLPQMLDPVYRDATIRATSLYIQKTPKMTGTTARYWSMPRRTGASSYVIANTSTTADKKRSIVNILDKGRGPVYPKKAKHLYIPLSNKGRSKKLGAPIPKGFKYGVDYVFARKAGPVVGKFFISPINKQIAARITNQSLRLLTSK